MRMKYKGQITIEAAIIVPIIMLIVVSLIYLSLYVHDAVVIKAYVYGAGNEYINEEFEKFKKSVSNKVNKASLFVISPQLEFEKQIDGYEISIYGNSKGKMSWIANLINYSYNPESVVLDKNMSSEIIYIAQVLQKQLERNQ